jgi:beta-galactosidase GanA
MVGLLKSHDQSIDIRTQDFMQKSVAGLFKTLDKKNITSDIIRSDLPINKEIINRYKVIFVPFQVVMRKSIAELLDEYVKQGGTLIMDARSATIDELDFAFEESPGLKLSELFAAKRVDWTAANQWYSINSEIKSLPDFQAKWFREELVPGKSAEILATFSDTKTPAIIQHKVGKGRAILLAVPLGASVEDSEESPLEYWMERWCEESKVSSTAEFISNQKKANLPIVRVHDSPNGKLIFVINHIAENVNGKLLLNSSLNKTSKVVDLLSEKEFLIQTKNASNYLGLNLSGNQVLVFEWN